MCDAPRMLLSTEAVLVVVEQIDQLRVGAANDKIEAESFKKNFLGEQYGIPHLLDFLNVFLSQTHVNKGMQGSTYRSVRQDVLRVETSDFGVTNPSHITKFPATFLRFRGKKYARSGDVLIYSHFRVYGACNQTCLTMIVL
jgi:hypothetical protein